VIYFLALLWNLGYGVGVWQRKWDPHALINLFANSKNTPTALVASITCALEETVTACARVGNQASQLILLIENNPIGTGRSTTVYFTRVQDGKFIVRAIHREREAFVIVIHVWIIVRADSLSGLVEAVALALGCGDGVAGVAVVAAGGGAGVSRGQQRPWQCEGPDAEEQGQGEELDAYFLNR
jgi:hypothetical protein